jgi:hypothetical protein
MDGLNCPHHLFHKVKRRIVGCDGQLALHEQVGKKRPSVEVSFNHFKLVVASFRKAGARGIGYRVLCTASIQSDHTGRGKVFLFLLKLEVKFFQCVAVRLNSGRRS